MKFQRNVDQTVMTFTIIFSTQVNLKQNPCRIIIIYHKMRRFVDLNRVMRISKVQNVVIQLGVGRLPRANKEGPTPNDGDVIK